MNSERTSRIALNLSVDEAVDAESIRSQFGTLGSAIDDIGALRGRTVIRSLEDLNSSLKGEDWELDFEEVPPTADICATLGDALLKGDPRSVAVRVSSPVTEEDRFLVGLVSEILISLKRSSAFIRLVSCPTCARCRIALMKYAQEISERLKGRRGDLTVAVMGCEVNGPGEAKMADIGIAFGKGAGLIFKKGEKVRKVPANEAIEALMEEVEAML